MSADNGIYILRTVRNRREVNTGHWVNDGGQHYVWRVVETGGIDNFDYYSDEQPYNLGAYMQMVWKDSPVFLDEKEALAHDSNTACILEREP